MKLRITATVLWFLVGWSGVGMLAGLLALPPAVAAVGGIATAMFVWFDPTGRLWPRPNVVRRVRPADEVAAELDERARQAPADSVEAVERA
jgi:hypothetical protein